MEHKYENSLQIESDDEYHLKYNWFTMHQPVDEEHHFAIIQKT